MWPSGSWSISELLHEILRHDPTPLHLGIELDRIERSKFSRSITVLDFMTVTAAATRRVSFGRNQICDVVLEADGAVVAYFTGQGTTPPAPKTQVQA